MANEDPKHRRVPDDGEKPEPGEQTPDDDEAPETPPTEPQPVPVEDPPLPDQPPYIVTGRCSPLEF